MPVLTMGPIGIIPELKRQGFRKEAAGLLLGKSNGHGVRRGAV